MLKKKHTAVRGQVCMCTICSTGHLFIRFNSIILYVFFIF